MSKRKIIEIYFDEENREIGLEAVLNKGQYTDNEKLIGLQVMTALQNLIDESNR